MNEWEVSNYFRCSECGTFAIRVFPDKATLYQTYEKKYWQALPKAFGYPTIQERAETDFHDRIPVWYKVLELFAPPPARILEIGCGHGGFLAYARDHGYNEVVGIEPDPEVAEFGRKKFRLKRLLSGFFPDVKLPYKNYDVITAFDVLEHLIDPIGSLKAIHSMLTEDGTCIIQTPCYRNEGKEWEQFAPEHNHIYLFNRQSVQKLFEKTGFYVEASIPSYFLHDVIFVCTKVGTGTHAHNSRFSQTSFQSRLQSLYMDLTDIRAQNEYALMRDRDEWVKRFQNLQRQLMEKDEEIKKVSHEAEARLVEMQKMGKALETERKEVAVLRGAVEKMEKAMKEKEKEIKVLTEARQKQEKMLVEWDKLLKEKDEEIKKVSHEAEARLVEMQKMGKALETEWKEVAVLRGAVEKMEKAMKEKEEEIKKVNHEAEARLVEMQKMGKALETERKEVAVLRGAVQEMEKAMKEKDEEIKRVSREAEARLVEMQKIEKALQEKDSMIRALKSTAEERLKAMEEKEEVLRTQEVELKRKETEIIRLAEIGQQQQKEIEKMNRELLNSREEIRELKKGIDSKEKELRKLILDIALLKENWGYRLATKIEGITSISKKNPKD